jgi:hypothetical protein
MSKKKLLTGKKTKLAKLALTRALENKASEIPETSAASDKVSPSLTEVVQALRQWQLPLDQTLTPDQRESALARSSSSQEYSYFHLLQDLRHLQELLHPAGLPTTPREAPKGRLTLPSPEIFQELIRLTVKTLRELKSLMD